MKLTKKIIIEMIEEEMEQAQAEEEQSAQSKSALYKKLRNDVAPQITKMNLDPREVEIIDAIFNKILNAANAGSLASRLKLVHDKLDAILGVK
jgi:hypothetical protein